MNTTYLGMAVALAFSTAVSAETLPDDRWTDNKETSNDISDGARPSDPTWEISVAAFRPKMALGVNAYAYATDGVAAREERASARGRDRFNGGSLEATWRFAPRQRLIGGWNKISGDNHYGAQTQGTFVSADPALNVDYAVDGTAKWDTDFELYRLSYGYDVYQGRTSTVTALVGVYGAKMRTSVRTQGTVVVDGVAYDLGSRNSYSKTAHAPGIGVLGQWRPHPKWDLRAGVQGFKTNWGNFDAQDGHFVHANAQVGYAFTPTWTAFAGYDWFELELKDRYAARTTFDGVAYAGNATLRGTLRVHGPTLGLRASF